MELERGLEDQVTLGCSLEKALGCKSFSQNVTQVSMPKPTTELVEEIGELKLEVVRLEQHLLSLYRKKFEHPSSSLFYSPRDDKLKSPMYAKVRSCLEFSKSNTKVRRQKFLCSV